MCFWLSVLCTCLLFVMNRMGKCVVSTLNFQYCFTHFEHRKKRTICLTKNNRSRSKFHLKKETDFQLMKFNRCSVFEIMSTLQCHRVDQIMNFIWRYVELTVRCLPAVEAEIFKSLRLNILCCKNRHANVTL